MLAPAEVWPMNANTQLAFTIEHHSQRSVLQLQGELDASNRDHLRDAISSALQRRPPVLVVDITGLSFTDCAGLSVLAWAHQRLAEHGQQLIIVGALPIVWRLLHLTGLDTYLHLSTPQSLTDDPDDSGPGR
jgi:anti-sigma B factor antagonist